jgi:hypothetical protein
VGIVVNALALQRERHSQAISAVSIPAAAPATAVKSPVIAAVPAPAAAVDPTPIAVVQPPSRPTGLGASADATPAVPPAARGVDAIGDILRAENGKDAQRLTLSARNALTKLGYSVKADNASTVAALHDFQRSHSLPLSSDITPRLVKQLVTAANAVGH